MKKLIISIIVIIIATTVAYSQSSVIPLPSHIVNDRTPKVLKQLAKNGYPNATIVTMATVERVTSLNERINEVEASMRNAQVLGGTPSIQITENKIEYFIVVFKPENSDKAQFARISCFFNFKEILTSIY